MILKLWEATEKIGERDVFFRASDVLELVLKSGKASGYTIGEMRDANKVLDKLDNPVTKLEKQVNLTDAEQALCSAALEGFRFAIVSENIVKLGDMLAAKNE